MSYIDNGDESSSDDDITQDLILQTVKTIPEQRYLYTREPIVKTDKQIKICLTN